MFLVRRRDGVRTVARMEKARNLRGLLRIVRQGREMEQGELLGAIQALARLRDPRAAATLQTAYEQAIGCASTPLALAYGMALAAIGDRYALRPLAQVLSLEVSHPELVTGEERELEQAVWAMRSLGSSAFDAIAPTFSGWAVPRQFHAPAAEDAQAPAAPEPNTRHRGKPVKEATPLASHAWLTEDSAYLLAGASGDARAIDILTPAVIDHFGCADGAPGAALGLGWLGATQAVDPLVAALLTSVVNERIERLRAAQPARAIPPLVEAVWRDLDGELSQWHRDLPDAQAATPGLRTGSLATITALGRLRCQQAAVPLLLAVLHRAQHDCLIAEPFARAMSMSLRRTGGLPVVWEVAQAVRNGVTFNLELQCRHALRHFGVELPAHDPLYALHETTTGVAAGPATQVFTIFPTQQLRVLVRFATNPHLRQLVLEELASRHASSRQTWPTTNPVVVARRASG